MPWSNQGGGPWGSGGSKGPWGQGPQSSGPTPPDLEELLRRSQDKLKSVLPGGSLGGRGILLIVLAAMVIWGFSGFFRVEPDELGVVLRFGKYTRDAKPGLNYHLPYPVETVLTPKVTRVNRIDIGMRLIEDPRRSGTQLRDIPEESLMLDRRREHRRRRRVGVLAGQAGRGRRVPVQHPEPGRDREGGRRKRDARGDRPLGNPADPDRRAAGDRDRRARADAEGARQLSGRRPGHAGADAEGRSARAGDRQLPRRAGRARRPRARAERSADLRQPRRPGRARPGGADPAGTPKPIASRRSPKPRARRRASAKVYEQYKKAPQVTRQRIYLETMERVFGGTDKIILDSGAAGQRQCRRRRADPAAQRNAAAHARRREAPNEARYRRRRHRRSRRHRGIVGYSVAVHRLSDAARARGPARPAGARRHRAGPELQDAADRQRDLCRQAHPRSGKRRAGSDRLGPEAARGRRLRALPHQATRCCSISRSARSRARTRGSPRCSTRRCAACSARRR